METREEQEGHADPEAASDKSCPSPTPEALPTTKPVDQARKKEALGHLSQTLPSQAPPTDNHNPTTPKVPTPRLIHSSLLRVPMQVRYLVYGAISNALFLLMYNLAVTYLGYLYVPSTIYAVAYLVFIPIQHAMASCMVFGWPQRYFPSLTSNVPIGLTAIALGSYLTAYLDGVNFDESAENFVRHLRVISTVESVAPTTPSKKKESSNGEFYSSFVVLIVTSFWSFILTVVVNSPTETSDKKQQ